MEKLKILVVEDNEATLNLLEIRLEKQGYEVAGAPDGETAVGLISERYFDVVITDMVMPGKVDGMGVLEETKKRHSRTEVIVVTSYASVDMAVEAMKKGAADYLEKPINFDELFIRLSKISTVRNLARQTSDLREAMNVTEKNAAQTIQDLEIQVASLRNGCKEASRILEDAGMDSRQRIDRALETLSSLSSL